MFGASLVHSFILRVSYHTLLSLHIFTNSFTLAIVKLIKQYIALYKNLQFCNYLNFIINKKECYLCITTYIAIQKI